MGIEDFKPGSAVVVELESISDDGKTGYAERGGVAITIANPVGEVGEYASVEIIDIDHGSKTVSAVSDNRPGLDSQYAAGDELTVSVDRVRKGSALVDIEPGRTLVITDYPHHHQDIEVVVRKAERDFLRCERLHRIDRLSTASLVELNHDYSSQFEFSDDLSEEDLNVFVSHLLAGGDWGLVRYVLSHFNDVGSVELSTTTTLLGELNSISPVIWRDILYTVVKELPELTASVGADYLAVVLDNDDFPQAWRESVRGNLALLMDVQNVGIKHSTIDLPAASQQHSTVTESSQSIRTRSTDSRDSTINRELREIWDDRCAMCGWSAVSRHDKTGIEGSHIYPVKYGGPDEIGNILPMCRNHHWAFENGWITITDDYTVEVHPETPEQVQELLAIEADDELLLVDGYEPDRKFLAMHRCIHGFETIDHGQQFPIKLKHLTEEGASVTFPDGTRLTVPIQALGDEVTRYFKVRITDVDRDHVQAVPQS